jgi:dipeptidyl aminopeptidase/acylaminoacyl peptidase
VVGGAKALGLLCALAVLPAADAQAGMHIRWSGPRDARAGVVLLHGGAWKAVGPAATAALQPAADRFAGLGLRVANVDYRAGASSLIDAGRALRRLHRRRVCVYGESAGGQLALMLAARHPSVRCVITVGAVGDLVGLRRDHATKLLLDLTARAWAHEPGGLRAHSPLTFAGRLRIPVLLAGLRHDPIVPVAQQRRLARRLPRARLLLQDAGSHAFVHGKASPAGLRRLHRAETGLLRRALLVGADKRRG